MESKLDADANVCALSSIIHYLYHRSSQAKLNNFIKLEPTFRLLEIPFNINMVRGAVCDKV